MMNSIEQYQNLVELLKKALEFYADSGSYQVPVESDKDYRFNCMRPEFHLKRVEIDGGSQARFALNQAKQLAEQIQKMQEDYDKFLSGYEQLQATEETVDPQELIKQLKLFTDDNNV